MSPGACRVLGVVIIYADYNEKTVSDLYKANERKTWPQFINTEKG